MLMIHFRFMFFVFNLFSFTEKIQKLIHWIEKWKLAPKSYIVFSRSKWNTMTSKTSPMLLPAVSSKLFSYIRQNTFKICIHVSKYIEWNILLTFSYVFDVEILFATSFIITADSQLPRNVQAASLSFFDVLRNAYFFRCKEAF